MLIISSLENMNLIGASVRDFV